MIDCSRCSLSSEMDLETFYFFFDKFKETKPCVTTDDLSSSAPVFVPDHHKMDGTRCMCVSQYGGRNVEKAHTNKKGCSLSPYLLKYLKS